MTHGQRRPRTNGKPPLEIVVEIRPFVIWPIECLPNQLSNFVFFFVLFTRWMWDKSIWHGRVFVRFVYTFIVLPRTILRRARHVIWPFVLKTSTPLETHSITPKENKRQRYIKVRLPDERLFVRQRQLQRGPIPSCWLTRLSRPFFHLGFTIVLVSCKWLTRAARWTLGLSRRLEYCGSHPARLTRYLLVKQGVCLRQRDWMWEQQPEGALHRDILFHLGSGANQGR